MTQGKKKKKKKNANISFTLKVEDSLPLDSHKT